MLGKVTNLTDRQNLLSLAKIAKILEFAIMVTEFEIGEYSMITNVLFVLSFFVFLYIIAHVPAMMYIKHKNPGRTVTFNINPILYKIFLALMLLTGLSFVFG